MTDGSTTRLRAKKSVVLVGTVLIALGSATGVTLAQPADQAPQQTPGTPSPPAARPVVDPAIPAAEPPPEPTSADFGRTAPVPDKAASAPAPPAPPPAPAIDWTAMPIDQLRAKANADDIPAMEELARRLVQGIGVPKDQQAGAGWMLRAAQRGSAQSAFNVGVMHERGFVVERDSTRAVEWYRKAADLGLAMAKHNLALMLREGKGAPRDGTEAIELLRSAARQGMSASMFTLGDIYERGDVTAKDQAMALAWFAIAAEFENQINRDGESQLGKTAAQRAQALKRILLPGELERAQQFGQAEFKEIVAALQPAKPPAASPAPGDSARPKSSTAPASEPDPPGWPKSAADQIRAVQQALLDLKLVRDKPDGALGPMTKAAIRSFQRSANLRETGEATKEVYVALQEAIARRDGAGAAKAESKPDATGEQAKTEVPTPADPPGWPKAAVDQVKAVQQALLELKLLRDKADGEIGPQTRDAIRAFQRAANLRETGEPTKEVYAALREEMARREANKPPPDATPQTPAATATESTPDPPGWPKAPVEQVKVVQQALFDLGLLRNKPDGEIGPTTRNAIKSFQRAANLAETGEPTKEVYAALREAVARRDANKPAVTEAPKAADPPGWPAATLDQVKAIQQGLLDLGLLRDRPDGDIGPQTRDAIRTFQRSANLAETGEPTKDVYAALQGAIARRGMSKQATADPPGWPAATLDQVKVIQQALFDLNFLGDKPDGDIGPMTREAIRAFQRSANLSETGEPTKEVFAALQEAIARRSVQKPGPGQSTSAATIDPGKHETAPAAPASADAAWPATTAEQIIAIQRLLRALNFTREEPDGLPGPLTSAAIREYQASVGLAQTGEPSKELFESLKEMRKLTGGKSN
jgi:peptidoglycan hydrolase-like protein with peptidoglycan-binding domain